MYWGRPRIYRLISGGIRSRIVFCAEIDYEINCNRCHCHIGCVIFAASNVFFINMAMVIGPTPPGTGVI